MVSFYQIFNFKQTKQFSDEPFVLKGINYFGFESETYTPHGIWSYDLNFYLDFIKVFMKMALQENKAKSSQNNNFNAIRVPFSLEMVKWD